MHRAPIILLGGGVAAFATFALLGTARDARGDPIQDYSCQQRQISCGMSTGGDCEMSLSDCLNHTCGSQCPTVAALICVPDSTKHCHQTELNACPDTVPVAKCKNPAQPGWCWCDEHDPVGSRACNVRYQCVIDG